LGSQRTVQQKKNPQVNLDDFLKMMTPYVLFFDCQAATAIATFFIFFYPSFLPQNRSFLPHFGSF
jgi:hypothetical protein